ncbi:MAG: DUF262 domain-containing protein [Pontiella sp.]
MATDAIQSTIPIEKLSGHRFTVEDYQRGYKWTSQQVLDLLEDVNAFNPQTDTFYCLQPLALVRLAEPFHFEVIDGQQRLTTVYMVMSLLAEPLYEVCYRTRKGSEEFLSDITDLKTVDRIDRNPTYAELDKFDDELDKAWLCYIEGKPKALDNTDNYHFFMAAQTVLSWAQFNADRVETLLTNLKEHTRFIWYEEAREKDPRVVFRNLNSGKIPLTNAELIKADIINGLKNSHLEIQRLQQNELATEWDQIEQSLHDDAFWFFINNDTDSERYETRIDFLFELLLKTTKHPREDNQYIYRQFSQRMVLPADNEAHLDWNDVKLAFYLLREWFEDQEIYHWAGYIIDRKLQRIQQLFNISQGCGKLEFKNRLVQIIREDFERFTGDGDGDFLARLQYNHHNKVIEKTLLLYNLELYQTSHASFRFPFDRFKKQKWSLEHIHAQNSEEFTSLKEVSDWLKDIEELQRSFSNVESESEGIKFPETAFKQMQQLVCSAAEEPDTTLSDEIRKVMQEMSEDLVGCFDLHAITNMALLDGSTNSSFSNRGFRDKRALLIEIDRKPWLHGKEKAFIPIGTKHVFLKHTSQTIEQLTIWGAQDRADYYAHLELTLRRYLPAPSGARGALSDLIEKALKCSGMQSEVQNA